MENRMEQRIVVDATNHRLGRLASILAKKLISGYDVVVVNAEKALITGNKESILERYNFLGSRRQLSSHKVITVKFQRRPENILGTAVLRMLRRKTPRGLKVRRRFKVYAGVPESLQSTVKVDFKEAMIRDARSRSGRLIRFVTLEELSSILRGGRGE